MARLLIKGNRDPYFIPNEKANKISNLMKQLSDKKIEDTWIDIEGSSWKGLLSQIKSIDIEEDRTYSALPKIELPDEQSRLSMIRVRENLKKNGWNL